ncbi:MAG: hypothetical protein QXL06_02010 [Nitrososphaerota archaeon]
MVLKYNAPYNWFSILTHVVFGFISGFLTGFLWPLGLALGIFLYVQFFLYEYFEEQKVSDEMFFELREFTTGYTIGLIISLAYKML